MFLQQPVDRSGESVEGLRWVPGWRGSWHNQAILTRSFAATGLRLDSRTNVKTSCADLCPAIIHPGHRPDGG